MDRQLQSYLGQIQIGEAQSYKNLTAYPVLSNQLSALDYITLDEALKQGLIEISEIDKDGSVPELELADKSEHVHQTVRESDEYGSRREPYGSRFRIRQPYQFVYSYALDRISSGQILWAVTHPVPLRKRRAAAP